MKKPASRTKKSSHVKAHSHKAVSIRQHFYAMTAEKWFAVCAATVLLLTTIYWSWFSAAVNAHNSDQLVEQYLFEHFKTLHGAIVPGAHSFMLKWPLFFVVQALGSDHLIAFATTVLCVTTVALFAYIMYRINKKPFIFGCLCLALAAALLLIPTEPYPGALLPVNMGMLSTRNIEYVLYIIALVYAIKAPKLLSWKNVASVSIFALLIASDKLFLALTLGGAILMLCFGLVCRRNNERNIGLRWLVSGIAATLIALLCLKVAGLIGLISIEDSAKATPYVFIHDIKGFILGCIYAVMGLLTETGANPAFDAMVVTAIPRTFVERLASVAGPAYLVTIAIFGTSLFAAAKLVTQKKQPKRKTVDAPYFLSLAMITTTIAAVGVFVITDHYQPADARYLAIALFMSFIVLATWLRHIKITAQARKCVGIAATLALAVIVAMAGFWQQNERSMTAYKDVAKRDALIASALKQHDTKTLVGDYWRVFPIRHLSPSQQVYPLSDCTVPRQILTSSAWAPDDGESFAYLYSLRPTSASYKSCKLEQITAQYGRPDSSQLIAGSPNNPEEMLLFYDFGSNAHKPIPNKQSPTSTILPQPVTNVAKSCPTGDVVMNIVAHQDDDLLFINPQTYHNLEAGDCVRSVYITAGDSGLTNLYWLGREEGTKAAYATMLHLTNPQWISRTVTLTGGSYVTIVKIKDNDRVSLIFMHLPDGNIAGQGFKATHNESLARLMHERIPAIHSVDGHSSYDSNQLTLALTELMDLYQPIQLNTQATTNHSKRFPDHSDHLATGWFASRAFAAYHEHQTDSRISYYIGYPIRERAANVAGDDLAMVRSVFFAYASHDSGACDSILNCSKMSYGYYLDRQYQE
jgi:LmbE family N-acetylglucosaminyl deacetylase